MNSFFEFLKTILGRPLIAWASLALASISYFVAVQYFGFAPKIPPRAAETLAVGSIALALVSISFLLFHMIHHAWGALVPRVRRHFSTRGLRSRILALSPGAQALVGFLVYTNEPSIWLLAELQSPIELRKAQMMKLIETHGRACHYKLDSDIHYALQSDFKFVTDLKIQQPEITKIQESAKAASGLISNLWMAN